MKKFVFYSLIMTLFLSTALPGFVGAEPQSKPNGPWIQPEQQTMLERFMDPEELHEKLEQIHDRARDGRMDLEVVGHSAKYDHPIYVAKFGDADTDNPKVFLQTAIHGDEQAGTEASLNLIQNLAMSNNKDVREILDNVTVWIVPMLNPDGAEIIELEEGQAKQRRNFQDWTPEEWGLSEDTPAPWYHGTDWASQELGYDVNRDFHPDLSFELNEDKGHLLPGVGTEPGFYVTPEARASRDVFQELEPDLFIDHHHRYSNTVSEDDDRLNTLQIIAQVVDEDNVVSHDGIDYQLSEESLKLSKQVNSHVYQVLQKGNSPYGAVSRYQEVDLPGTALGSYSLNDAAIMLYETRGQQHPNGHTGQKSSGMLIKQSYIGLFETLSGLATGEIFEIDPEFYDTEIPTYSPRIGRPN
ncbi:M14 family zinc carboxypeptidase [Salipaludibacillus keqinensis]|uniref:M14 family zinc carboxypeptidase n=1 Tax=Salipaludibacillus keqinensis TaxID=2045207 RepID=UPI001304F524|nr:M14 family zinc carboxypeptidase [Salipaludibacillus keqinensis]